MLIGHFSENALCKMNHWALLRSSFVNQISVIECRSLVHIGFQEVTLLELNQVSIPALYLKDGLLGSIRMENVIRIFLFRRRPTTFPASKELSRQQLNEIVLSNLRLWRSNRRCAIRLSPSAKSHSPPALFEKGKPSVYNFFVLSMRTHRTGETTQFLCCFLFVFSAHKARTPRHARFPH